MTIQELYIHFEAYLLTHKRLCHNTITAYRIDIRQFMHFLDDKQYAIENLDVILLKNFIHTLFDQELSAQSIARKISALKSLFIYAHEYFGCANVAQSLIIPKIEKKLPRYLNEEDVEKLLNYVDQDHSPIGVRNKTMIYLLYVSGVRVTELVTLKVSAIQFENSALLVYGKGGKERVIPLPKPMMSLLHNYLEHTYSLLIGCNVTNNIRCDELFPAKYGKKLKPLSRQAFWKIIGSVCKNAGITQHVSPHVLRHTIATHLLRRGYNIRSLQLLLGHEHITTVQLYTHVQIDHLRIIYDKKHPRS